MLALDGREGFPSQTAERTVIAPAYVPSTLPALWLLPSFLSVAVVGNRFWRVQVGLRQADQEDHGRRDRLVGERLLGASSRG